MSWTDERIALLKKMWKEGKSAAEIAKTLGKGVTRNAVIGKAHRMGLSGRPSPIKKTAAPKKEPAAKKETAKAARGKKAIPPAAPPAAKAKSAAEAPKDVEDIRIFEKDVIPPGGGVALIDLTERMCKWPIGDPREPDFTFCGRPNRAGTPYCPEHAALAYQTSSRSRGGAAAAAVKKPRDVEDVDVDVVDADADTDADDDIADDDVE